MPILQITERLRAYCGGASAIELEGELLAELLSDLAARFPELGSRVLDPTGGLASHLVVIHNDVVLRPTKIADVQVCERDELRLFTAVSGG